MLAATVVAGLSGPHLRIGAVVLDSPHCYMLPSLLPRWLAHTRVACLRKTGCSVADRPPNAHALHARTHTRRRVHARLLTFARTCMRRRVCSTVEGKTCGRGFAAAAACSWHYLSRMVIRCSPSNCRGRASRHLCLCPMSSAPLPAALLHTLAPGPSALRLVLLQEPAMTLIWPRAQPPLRQFAQHRAGWGGCLLAAGTSTCTASRSGRSCPC